MLRFSIGKIPVEVRASHVFFNFVLALLFSQNAFPIFGIPPLVAILCWVAIIGLSVLVHELGHASVSAAFGYKPSIVLVAMGGYTSTPAEQPIPWLKNIALTLAGPAAGYSLALLAKLLSSLVPPDNFPVLAYVFSGFFWANLIWSTLNLIPIGPLDGGRAAHAFFSHLSPRRGPLYAQLLGLAFGLPILFWALSHGQLILAVFLGMFMLRAFFLVVDLTRNSPGPASDASPPAPDAPHPQLHASEDLAHIQRLLEQGAYAEGLQMAENLLACPLPPSENAQAHLLAGWLSLKNNQARRALNHFSLAQGLRVPPQALAACFSLLGEDERALPLWQEAAEDSNNPTLLHEWAGTLVRLGRTEEAARLPFVRLAKAFLCAESVFRLRREYFQAAQAAEDAFELEPLPEVAFDAACNYALAQKNEAALKMLQLASQNGFDEPHRALADAALKSLHHLPEFQQWLRTLGPGGSR